MYHQSMSYILQGDYLAGRQCAIHFHIRKDPPVAESQAPFVLFLRPIISRQRPKSIRALRVSN